MADYTMDLNEREVDQLVSTLLGTNLGIGDALEKMGHIIAEFRPLSRATFDKLSEQIFYCYPCREWKSVVFFNDRGVFNRCQNCMISLTS